MLRERQNRLFMLCVALLCAGLIGGCFFFCTQLTHAARTLMLGREAAITTSLMEMGMPAQRIAVAISADAGSEQASALMARIGRSENMQMQFFPALEAFERGVLGRLMPGIVLCAVLFSGISLLLLYGLDTRYREAERRIRRFAGGDFSVHLPRTGEGALSRLLASVDDLACMLQAKGEIEHKTKAFLKDTLCDISHQLKTPLAALRMYHEIIQEEAGDAAVVTAFSQKTELALVRMEGLIQALLKMTRLDAGSIDFVREQVRVSLLVSRAMGELKIRAQREQKQLVVRGNLEETVICDPEWTCEALGNLIQNALDHTKAGGQVAISWRRSSAMLRITVSDDGCGIAPEDVHHIFKRFYRSARSMDRQGVGLGLPLAKAIVEGQGGVLSVHSAPGQGASFTASFLFSDPYMTQM